MFLYGGSYFLCGLFSTWLAKKLSISSLIKLGGISIGLGGALMVCLISTGNISSLKILASMAVITFGVTIVRASATTGALASIPAQAGQGSAGLNLIQFAMSAVIVTFVSMYGSNPEWSISSLAILNSILIIYLIKRLSV